MSPWLLAQAWPFVHPGLAAAAAAAALLPVLIHFINRRRFRRVPWAAMAFLMAANRRSAKRVRLENILLLALRMAVVLAAGLAFARPFFANTAMGLRASRVHRIILLDNSLSMQAVRPDGRTRFDAAVAVAHRLLQSFPMGDGVSVVTVANPGEPLIASPTHDRRLVSEALTSALVTQGVDDMVGAMDTVRELLRESDTAPNNRAVYVISDFPRSDWESEASGQASGAARKLAELAEQLGLESNLVLVRVEPGNIENLAVTDFRPEASLLSVQVPASFVVNVTNFGETTVRGAMLQLRRDKQTTRRHALPALAPGETVGSVLTTELSSAGSKLLEARVVSGTSDSLPLDDARWLALEARDSVPILIVDGQPGSRSIDGQAGYLAVALAPREVTTVRPTLSWGRTVTNLYEVKVISEPELVSELSNSYDVVALCNVPRLTSGQWSALERFVANGGGVFISLGGLIDPENYNRHGFAEGRGILPAPLERDAEQNPITGRLGFKLGSDTSLFEDFSEHHSSGLFSARVDRYFALGATQPNAEIPLRFTNDDPALVLLTKGAGRVALWTTTSNMEWNNLPGRGDFVAVMAKAVGALTRRPGEYRNLLVGESLVERLRPEETSLALRVFWGEGRSGEPAILPVGEELTAQFGPLGSAGPMSLSIGAERRDFAVNVDTRESALPGADPEAVAAAVGRALQWMGEDDLPELAGAGSIEWASTLLWAVLGLLLLELLLAQRFSTAHPVREGSKRRLRRAGARSGVRGLSGVTSP